jgi:hypothetical protein
VVMMKNVGDAVGSSFKTEDDHEDTHTN